MKHVKQTQIKQMLQLNNFSVNYLNEIYIKYDQIKLLINKTFV